MPVLGSISILKNLGVADDWATTVERCLFEWYDYAKKVLSKILLPRLKDP